jgi:4-hydroxy-2-oxoheptanedioate aldolase
MRRLRQVLQDQGVAFGAWAVLPSPFATELLARSGYDWMCVDAQHGQVDSIKTLMPLLQVMNRHDVPAFVRIPWKTDFSFAMYALDYGAQGIIVPMVDTPEEAARIAASVRYAPVGERSWAPIRASLEIEGYTPAVANDLVCCMVMIETRSGLEQLDYILSVPGVDGAYVGPSDLSVAHGGPPVPNSSNPLLCELASRVAEGCRRAGKIAGFHAEDANEALYWSSHGFQLVNVAVDAALVAKGSAAAMAKLAEQRRGREPTGLSADTASVQSFGCGSHEVTRRAQGTEEGEAEPS